MNAASTSEKLYCLWIPVEFIEEHLGLDSELFTFTMHVVSERTDVTFPHFQITYAVRSNESREQHGLLTLTRLDCLLLPLPSRPYLLVLFLKRVLQILLIFNGHYG